MLIITLVGLSLGAIPALSAYVVAGVILLVASLPPPGESWREPDLVRLVVFAFGSPVVIVLGLRSEWQQRADRAARRASSAAEEGANQARLAADAARLQVRDALEQVDRERARLVEVAQAIPEPLIVYGPDGLGHLRQRRRPARLRAELLDRPLDEWARRGAARRTGKAAAARRVATAAAHDRDPCSNGYWCACRCQGATCSSTSRARPRRTVAAVLLLRDVGKEVDERRRLSRFASFVAHELRNPLAVAKARMELAKRGREAAAAASTMGRGRWSRSTRQSASSSASSCSRGPEAAAWTPSQEPFDLREAVDAGVERLQAQGSEREVRVTAHGDPVVLGDGA